MRHWCSTSPVPGSDNHCVNLDVKLYIVENLRMKKVTHNGTVNIEPPVANEVLLVVESPIWAEQR